MSDWQAGDLALCIKGGKISHNPITLPHYPEKGVIYTVEGYGIIPFFCGESPALWLKNGPLNISRQKVWPAYRFIKVTPEEEDEFDKEVINLYNSKQKECVQ